MARKKRNILFIHDAYPNQLSAVHEYFLKHGDVESFFLTQEVSREYRQFEPDFPDHVFSYTPDGYNNQQSYYYSGEVEKTARNAVNIVKAVRRIHEHRPLDLIMAHDRAGSPHLIFDALSIPVVGYSEFPDFAKYGWDERYPPVLGQQQVDAFCQAITYQSVIKSAVTIVPSEHAKRMYPTILQPKIVVQMDAFDVEKRRVYSPKQAAFKKEKGLTYVGFAASVLSSEKGLEHFIQISQRLAAQNDKLRFVLVGSEMTGACYGFERQFLEQIYGKGQKSFLEYLFEKYNVDRSVYIKVGLLSEDVFSSTLHHIDFFLYPLQYGVANWGLFELLIRGKVVIASNGCFIPEIIEDGVNGFLLDVNDHDTWCKLALDVANNPKKYAAIGSRAKRASNAYRVDVVAKKYLDIFEKRVWKTSRTTI